MARHIPNAQKLLRIVENERRPFAFSLDEALRIRQLIGESLVTFFALLNDHPNPGPQSIPPGTPGTESPPKKRKRR